MKKKLLLSLFGIKIDKPQQTIFDHKVTIKTTMPTEEITYDEWVKGKWVEYLWKNPTLKHA